MFYFIFISFLRPKRFEWMIWFLTSSPIEERKRKISMDYKIAWLFQKLWCGQRSLYNALKELLHKKCSFDGRLASLRQVQGHLCCLPRPSHWPATDKKVLIVFGPLGPEVCQLVPWKPANWCPESLTGALEIAAWSAEQAAVSRAPDKLSGHQFAGFQGTS